MRYDPNITERISWSPTRLQGKCIVRARSRAERFPDSFSENMGKRLHKPHPYTGIVQNKAFYRGMHLAWLRKGVSVKVVTLWCIKGSDREFPESMQLNK